MVLKARCLDRDFRTRALSSARRRPASSARPRGGSAPSKLRLCFFVALAFCSAVCAQDKVTYQDHVLPLIETHCSKCHNPDKKKGDLDLTSFSGALKGAGSGAVLVSGNPDASKLWKAITHAEEPTMPPNKPRLADKELDVFRQWIAGGLLETTGSKAIIATKPSVDFTLKNVSAGKPDGPPPMPADLPLEPVVHAARGNPLTGLAASPWAPLLAVAGQKQVLLYHSDTLELLGILPFTEGQPCDVKFSRNGRLLLAAGGRGALTGRVLVWDVTTGERLMAIGDEHDTVLAADLRLDQSQIALGGPSRFVKVFSTKTGELQHKIKKHTDWVTAAVFSPDGELLASADRNGGISVWDPDNAQELFTLAGHRAAVTALSWRSDSKLLASSSEDGAVKLWEMQEGRQARTWTAHSGGALAVSYTHDGRLLTCGRDNAVTLWDAGGNKVRSFDFFDELPLRAIFSHDAQRVFATDFTGRIGVWDAAASKRIGELDANPPTLAGQLAAAEKRVAELQARGNQPSPNLAPAEAELARATAEADSARKALDAARTDQTAKENEVVRLKEIAARSSPPPDIDAKLAEARAVRAKARETVTNAVEALQTKSAAEAAAREKVARAKAEDAATLLAQAKAKVARLKQAQRWSSLYYAREALAAKKREHEKLLALVAAHQEAARQAEKDAASAKDAAERARFKEQIKSSVAEAKKHELAAKKLAAEIATDEARLRQLNAEFEREKSAAAAIADRSKS
jgi:hypothetical protein